MESGLRVRGDGEWETALPREQRNGPDPQNFHVRASLLLRSVWLALIASESLFQPSGATPQIMRTNSPRTSALFSRRVMGTPTSAVWPGVEELPHYQWAIPGTPAVGLKDAVGVSLDSAGLSLLSV